MRIICFFLFFLVATPSFAQIEEEQPEIEKDSVPETADPFYREDQFYATISYNLMQGKPSGLKLNSFSLGLTAGFLRDIPINEARNRAIAIGFGYSYNNIKNNLYTIEEEGKRYYTVDLEGDYDKNRQVLQYLEIPVEFRWRNSDAISHKFWRIYVGFKVSYLISDKSQFEYFGSKIRVKNNNDYNDFLLGSYLSAGWNTWNFYMSYTFTPLYKSAYLASGEQIKMNSLNLGLVFYIL